MLGTVLRDGKQTTAKLPLKLSDSDAQRLPALYQRRFTIDVDGKDPLQQRLRLIVTDEATSQHWIFWVDMYDFPLVTFTPLSRDERFALVLDRYDDGFGLAWPGSGWPTSRPRAAAPRTSRMSPT